MCLEIADVVLNQPGQKDYEFPVALDPDPVGFAVWGLNPCCEGVLELYWIVSGRRGVGTELLKHMETHLPAGTRMCMVETSGKPEYDSQRQFYVRRGFREVARIGDYYRRGDDLVLYRKDY